MKQVKYVASVAAPQRGGIRYRLKDDENRTLELLDLEGAVAVRLVLSGYDTTDLGRVSTPGLILEFGSTRLDVGFAESEVYNDTTNDDIHFQTPGLELYAELRGFGSEEETTLLCEWRGDALVLRFDEESSAAESNGRRYGELIISPPLLERVLVMGSHSRNAKRSSVAEGENRQGPA